MSGVEAARAAVLAASEGGHLENPGSWHLRADGGCRTNLALVVLPPGRRAAELGRSILGFPNGPEWERAGLGRAVRVETEVPNWAAEQLFWAGRVDVDAGALAQELAPPREEGVRLWKANESPLSPVRKVVGLPAFAGRFAGSLVREWKDAIGDLREGDAHPGAAALPPVEGVSYEHWMRVKAELGRDEVHPSHVDLYTHYRGIPWQRWAAIDAEWSRRCSELRG